MSEPVPSEPRRVTEPEPLAGLRILLVHPRAQSDLSRTLKRDGHDVLVVSPQDRPLRYVGVFRPQVIVVAASEAPQICQELRGALQHVSILAIVPGSDVRDRVAVLEAGAEDCLSVPVHRAELIARVRTARRRRSALSDETGMEPVQPTARRR